MVRVLVERLVGLVLTLLVGSFLIYGAMYLAPGTPAAVVAGGHATSSELQSIRHQLHLNEPFFVRYWDWLDGVLHGNLGRSFVYREPVTLLLSGRVMNTVFLVVFAALLIITGGVVLGLLAALRRRLGIVITAGMSVGLAVPSFVAAIVLISVFAVDLKWFPAASTGTGFFGQLHHMTLPAIALALSWLAFTGQLTKAAVREELAKDQVETAQSRGIKPRHVVTRHVLRNALIPITTVSGITVAGLIAGDVVVEQAFGINGLGSFLVQAVEQKDFASVQAVALILVTAFVVVNGIVDVGNRFLDPRLREPVV